DVIFSSPGGEIDPAFVFSSFMEGFDRRENVRAVAVGQVASAGIPMFLGFPRRTAKFTARFRFHKVSVHMPPRSKSGLRAYFEIVEDQLARSISESTSLSVETVKQFMNEERVISDHFELLSNGLITE